MYKESWGLKRICPMCSKQYYDLGRTELECPECGKEIEVSTLLRPRRGRKPGSTNATFLTNPIPPKPTSIVLIFFINNFPNYKMFALLK